MSASLELQDVRKSWGATTILHGVGLDVQPGMFVSLLGPSGCGKTTLLRIITGYLAPDSGRISMNGRDITNQPTHRRNMGMVFQSFALFPHLTVADNVGFPLDVRGVKGAERASRIDQALAAVHLQQYRDSHPRQLSGGQQQRVGLARAIVYRPEVLLLDEPLSNLDASLREEMRLEISELTRRLEMTSIYVTHDQKEALALSTRIAVMNQGRVVQFGTPEDIYRRPQSAFVARFVGYANAVPAQAANGQISLLGRPAFPAPRATNLNGPVTAFIHASDIELCSARDPDGISCRLIEIGFMGDHMEYLLEHPSTLRFKVYAPVTSAVLDRGAAVAVRLPPEKLVIVPEDSP